MRYVFFTVIAVFFLCAGFSSCDSAGRTAGSPSGQNPGETFGRDASYALGMNMGANLKEDGIFPNLEEMVQGMRDIIYGTNTRFSMEESREILFEALSAESRQAENTFLAENSQRPGIIITASGLQYEVIVEGDGPKPAFHNTVLVHYEGTFTNGNVFDSSFMRMEPVEFPLFGVIPGWAEGIQLMSVGSKYRLFIPSELAYGTEGAFDAMGRQIIPPFSALIFEVELLDIIQ